MFDGLGNQVRKFVAREIVDGSSMERSFCHGFDEDHDAAGAHQRELRGSTIARLIVAYVPAGTSSLAAK
jgi:hypothetical protein